MVSDCGGVSAVPRAGSACALRRALVCGDGVRCSTVCAMQGATAAPSSGRSRALHVRRGQKRWQNVSSDTPSTRFARNLLVD